jgi:hypothetical protein
MVGGDAGILDGNRSVIIQSIARLLIHLYTYSFKSSINPSMQLQVYLFACLLVLYGFLQRPLSLSLFSSGHLSYFRNFTA